MAAGQQPILIQDSQGDMVDVAPPPLWGSRPCRLRTPPCLFPTIPRGPGSTRAKSRPVGPPPPGGGPRPGAAGGREPELSLIHI
eukprot:10082755-Alexandrium_andersonii.AAC.1